MSKRTSRIASAASTVGLATLASRILGFVRDAIIAWAFPKMATDAFFVAFRIPNLLRRLFAEGALTVSFIPVFTEAHLKDRDEAMRIFRIAYTLLTITLLFVVAAGIYFAVPITKVFAPGFFDDPAKASLTVKLTRIMFPYILLVSLVAFSQGVLNSLKHFFAPAISPVFLNIWMIVGAVALSLLFEDRITGLAIGVLLGGLTQVLFQLPYLRRHGVPLKPKLQFKHPAVRRILVLMGPAAFGMLVYQFNIIISSILASLLPSGSVSYLWYGQRLTELPLGIFAVAIGTAVLPSLSEERAKNDMEGFKDSFNYALRLVIFLTIPASAGFAIMSLPIISVLFQRGNFSYTDALQTANVLVYFSVGLWAIAGVRVSVPAFYSMQDTKTPVKIAVGAFVLNAVASVLLMGPNYVASRFGMEVGGILGQLDMKANGLALATSISATANFIALIYFLRRRIGPIGLTRISATFLKTVISSVPLVIIAFSFTSMGDWEPAGITANKGLCLAGGVIFGAGGFFLASYLLKQEELTDLIGIFRSKLKKNSDESMDS